MVWHNKVAWSEGLFLHPQLFQQQERYLEHLAHLRCEPMARDFWGFTALTLDSGALALGRIAITRASGLWPDGVPFDVPRLGPAPEPLALLPDHQGQRIVLALPPCTPQAEDASFDPRDARAARYTVFDAELRDVNSIGMGARSVQLLQLRLRLFAESELPSGWMSLPVARVQAMHADGSAELDTRMIPPLAVAEASECLMRWLGELHGLVGQRAAQLAQRLAGESRLQAVDVADHLLLQLLNMHESQLGHLVEIRRVAPERVHELLCALAAGLATHLHADTRRPRTLPHYAHRDPAASFEPLVGELRELLHRAVRRGAEAIELQQQSHGMHVASVAPALLKEFGMLVLVASAQMPQETFVQQLLAQAKVAPAPRLAELVRLHLPGIGLRVLPVPPRQIPFHADHVYFQLERDGALWQQMLEHGGIGLHLAAELPGLQLQLWGVR